MVPLASTISSIPGVLLGGLPVLLGAIIGALLSPLMFALLHRRQEDAETALTQANLLEKLEGITTQQGAKLIEQASTIAELKQRLTVIENTLVRTQGEK